MLTRRQRPWQTKTEQGRTETGNKFYQTPLWRMLRKQRLKQDPCCKMCMIKGIVTEARVCDHKRPRRLWPERESDYGNTQSLCDPCHNSKSGKEATVFSRAQWNELAKKEGWI